MNEQPGRMGENFRLFLELYSHADDNNTELPGEELDEQAHGGLEQARSRTGEQLLIRGLPPSPLKRDFLKKSGAHFDSSIFTPRLFISTHNAVDFVC